MPEVKRETVVDEKHTKTVEYGGASNGQPAPKPPPESVPKSLPHHTQESKHNHNPIYNRVMSGAIFVASPPNSAKLDFPSAAASIGPIGNPAAALAGFTLNAASVLLREAQAGKQMSVVAPVGTLERAILAEAAFRVVERLDLDAPYNQQVEDAMKHHIDTIGIKVAAAAPIVMDSIMEPVLRIVLDQLKRPCAKGHNCHQGTSFDDHYWKNSQISIPTASPLSNQLMTSFKQAYKDAPTPAESQEEFLWGLAGPLIGAAGNLLGGLLKGKNKAESSMAGEGDEEGIFSRIPWNTLGKLGGAALRKGVDILDKRNAAKKAAAGGTESEMGGDEELFGIRIPILSDLLGESAMAESETGGEELFGIRIPIISDLLGESAMAESETGGEELFGFRIPIISDILGESTMVSETKNSRVSSHGKTSLPTGSIGGDLVRRAIAGEAALQAFLELPVEVLEDEGIMEGLATFVKDIAPGLPKYTIPAMKNLAPKIRSMVVNKAGKGGQKKLNGAPPNGTPSQHNSSLKKRKSLLLPGGYSHTASKFVNQSSPQEV
ncbi:uncharacterized protein BDZ99DRAFT_539257 [Mytilinidion resinicola]|uniref:Uncharacterized protein n=1 Tax=Mytilinidion resinicola TaxID=574789 RepID=A0A6A6YB88_9PEZI|nr:uncharacterized protein BDZ99DRAFT_539257 [Mytilinidion resinicola]KAF2805960.1 hypothetical protein BDZ99DRAFT_539257 [Mytilinidion resinicola]